MVVGKEGWRVHAVRDLFDAAVQHLNVGVFCRRCRHRSVLCAVGLWYRFSRKGWQDMIRDVGRHLRCSQCGARNPAIELVTGAADGPALPLPDDREWKRALSRRR